MIIKEHLGQFSLGEVFKYVEDPRSPQGKLYPLQFLLNCAQSAILSGATGFRQIGEWINAQPFGKLKRMGNIYPRKPDESTLRKCFKKLNINSFRELCYLWSTQKSSELEDSHKAIAVDGKTLRGSRNSDNRQPHMLSAISHDTGLLLGDLLVPNKKSEVQYIQPLLDSLDIKGKIITADALHTIKGFGQYLVAKGADYVFIAKGNKQKLIVRLNMLDIPSNHYSAYKIEEVSHGRIETRKLMLIDDLPFWLAFKSAEQAFIIERERINQKSGKIESEAHFGLTSLSSDKADAKKILEIIRGHWSIENRGFYVRDQTLFEDRSTQIGDFA